MSTSTSENASIVRTLFDLFCNANGFSPVLTDEKQKIRTDRHTDRYAFTSVVDQCITSMFVPAQGTFLTGFPERMDVWMDGRTDIWTDRRTYGRMDG